MKVNRLMNALLVFLILIISIGAVSASEDASMDDALAGIDSESAAVSQDSVLNEANNDDYLNEVQDVNAGDALDDENTLSSAQTEVLSDGDTMSYKEFQTALIPVNEYNLTKDVKYNPETDSEYPYILIAKHLTINANGHTFDGNNLAKIFLVDTSGAFTLNDAIIKNGLYNGTNAGGHSGGAMYIGGNGTVTLNNVTFIDNHAIKNNESILKGGAIYINKERRNVNINNCTFENNSASSYGGAISVNKGSVTISDSKFKHNYLENDHGVGGAIFAYGVTIDNCDFIDNRAGKEQGLGGAISSPTVKVNNSRFINNSAEFAGAIGDYFDGMSIIDMVVTNSKFENNTAKIAGGAIRITNDGMGADLSIDNSSFTNNNGGDYAGGAIIAVNTSVKNSNFTGNKVYDYAGAISSSVLDVDNCIFENNTAKNSAAIFAINLTVKDSQFKGNEAETGAVITATAGFPHEGTELPAVREYDPKYVYDFITYELWGYINDRNVFCMEREFLRYAADSAHFISYVDTFYTSDRHYLVNYVNKIEVYEHLKILYYLCNVDENFLEYPISSIYGHDELTGLILALTEEDLNNPQDESIKKVMELYNSGFRVPDKQYMLPNGTLVKYSINFFLNAECYQNYIYYRQTTEDVNETVSKETLNKTVKIGDQVQFRITVTNNGNTSLKEVFVNDSDFDEGLIYQSYINETGKWTYNETTHIWTLIGDLEAGKSASFIIIFKTNKLGELVNNVTAGFGNYTMANATNTTNVTDEEDNTTNETEIPEIDIPEEDTPDDDVPDDDDEDEVPDEDVPDKSTTQKVLVSKTATGNPLFALVLMIAALVFVPRRNH